MLQIRHNFAGRDFDGGRGCVSRATDVVEGRRPLGGVNAQLARGWLGACVACVACVALVGGGAAGWASEKEGTCIDYYAVGVSRCADAPQQPVGETSGTLQKAEPRPLEEKDAVDTFLENYGKPPREFVEFYLNPTPENAQKWAASYQEMLKKSQNLSQMWSDAERLYTMPELAPVPKQVQASPAQVAVPAKPVVQPVSGQSIGAFAGVAPAASGVQGVQSEPIQAAYYFSQTCPFCARMTPELNEIVQKYKGKLKLTCIDVTPIAAETKPDPAYLSGKLECNWRLPEAGELVEQEIRQTPTLVIRQKGLAPVRLSGYMSQVQLEPYFQK